MSIAIVGVPGGFLCQGCNKQPGETFTDVFYMLQHVVLWHIQQGEFVPQDQLCGLIMEAISMKGAVARESVVRIETAVYKRFREHCQQNGLIAAGVVSRLVADYLKNPNGAEPLSTHRPKSKKIPGRGKRLPKKALNR